MSLTMSELDELRTRPFTFAAYQQVATLSFEDAYALWERPLWRLAKKMLPEHHRTWARDLAQDVWLSHLKVWDTERERCTHAANQRALLCRSTSNKVIDYMRRTRHKSGIGSAVTFTVCRNDFIGEGADRSLDCADPDPWGEPDARLEMAEMGETGQKILRLLNDAFAHTKHMPAIRLYLQGYAPSEVYAILSAQGHKRTYPAVKMSNYRMRAILTRAGLVPDDADWAPVQHAS